MKFLQPTTEKGYFSGYYCKHQGQNGTIAFIPAVHRNGDGVSSASIQVITENFSHTFELPVHECIISPHSFFMKIGENIFCKHGIAIKLESDVLSISGALRYGAFTPLPYPIMGPFEVLAHMQCKHSVVSMHHSLHGSLRVNSRKMNFTGGCGYIESDAGTSFPIAYTWTQCTSVLGEPVSVMLAVADVPVIGTSFTGCIASVLYQGELIRLASYLGARVILWQEGEIEIRQGAYTLSARRLFGEAPQPLNAPVQGEMKRTVHESCACTVHYRFERAGEPLFFFTGDAASFEEFF